MKQHSHQEPSCLNPLVSSPVASIPFCVTSGRHKLLLRWNSDVGSLVSEYHSPTTRSKVYLLHPAPPGHCLRTLGVDSLHTLGDNLLPSFFPSGADTRIIVIVNHKCCQAMDGQSRHWLQWSRQSLVIHSFDWPSAHH